MNFYWPWALYLVPVVLPLTALLLIWGERRYGQRLYQILGPRATSKSKKDFALKFLLVTLAVAFMVFSMARPRWGYEEQDLKREGFDIMLAFDVSRSMLARDISPDRLSRAKMESIDLLRALQGDRIGLIPFAGMAYVQCPLTIDYNAVKLFLQNLGPDLIPVPGTAIGDAIRLATESFTAMASDTSKILILITDGEDHQSDPLSAAREAARAGVQIHTVGIGALDGAPIPSPDGSFLRDSSGQLVISRMDDSLLRQIAEITGGTHTRSTQGSLGLESLYRQQIRGALTATELYQEQHRVWYERYFWFASLAALFLFAEGFLRR